MLLTVGINKRILAAVFCVLCVLSSSAQKADKDSMLSQINKRLDLITSMIDSNKKVLTDSIQKLNRSLISFSTELVTLKSNSLEDQRKIERLNITVQDLQRNSTIGKKTDQELVGQMIKAISQESYRVNWKLVSSILELARNKESAELPYMEHFVKAYELINAAGQCLNKPYNPDTVKGYLNKLNDFRWKLFSTPALEVDKANMTELLGEYCSEYNYIAKEINDTRGMSSQDRKKILESKKYRVEDYPYLMNLLDLAIQNKDTPLSPLNCPPQK